MEWLRLCLIGARIIRSTLFREAVQRLSPVIEDSCPAANFSKEALQ
jgi:hypothetical protein